MPDESPSNESTPPTNEQPIQDITPKPTASESPRSFSSPVGAEVEPATNSASFGSSYGSEQPTSASAAMESALKDPAYVAPAPAPKKSKKKMIIVSSIFVLIGALIAGAAAVYALWYQNPDKVVADAMAHALMAKSGEHSGTISYETTAASGGEAQNATISFNVHHTRATGDATATFKGKIDKKDLNVTGSVVYDSKTDTYVKVDGLKKIVEYFTNDASYQAFASKYDSKWILIAAEMLKKNNPELAKAQKCVSDVLKKAESDNSYLQEVGTLYESNRFIVVKEKLGDKNGNLGYVVTVDEQKFKTFSNRMKTTKLQKEITACSGSTAAQVDDAINSNNNTSKNQPRIEVWINRWTHQLAEINVTDSQDGAKFTMKVTTNFTKPVTITAPSGAVSAEELMKDMEQQSKVSDAQSSAMMVQKKAEAYNAIHSKYPTLDELKAAKDEAALDAELKALVGTVAPTAQSTTKIQYKLCDPKQAPAIGYYDETKKAVAPVENSTTCKL